MPARTIIKAQGRHVRGGRLAVIVISSSGFSPKNRETAPLIILPIPPGFVKISVIRISPGCAGSISSRSHLLIVVRGGRGWKFNLGFGLQSCKPILISIFAG